MTYRDQEEKLFERWAQRARKLRDADMITKDGLLYRGEVSWDGFCQIHHPANEQQLWDDAGMRLLVLTKELFEEDCWDIRTETGRVPSPRLTVRTAQRFFPNLELWAYGLLTIPERKVIPFAKADNPTRLQGFYENAPIARVNCKKQPDMKAVSNAVLQKYMDGYADLLREQITMYHADIILCLGGQGIMVNFIRKNVYTDLEDVNAHCFYSPSANVLVVKQYHPTYNVYSRKEMYSGMIQDYQAFLKATPQFPTQR
ncbi:MAG: hypothetical protein J6T19_07010 [Paludibacteraceae bacterium]|nr:hypothetical protein [Paludibacteraceae bacterium]